MIVASDHGEELFERGRFAHGNALFQDQAIIPWLMAKSAKSA